MSDYRGECLFCGQPVRGHCARELSSAWEVERHAGGANKITGPKTYSGRIAHPVCQSTRAAAERTGVGAEQESLL